MKATLRTLLVLAGVAGFLTGNTLLAQSGNPSPSETELFHPTRILAKFKASEGEKAGPRQSALKQQGLKVHRQFKLLPQVVVLDLEDEMQVKAANALPPQARAKRLWNRIAALQVTGLFEYVEPDYTRTLNAEPTDSAFVDGTLWALRNLGQSNGVAGADIGAVPAWDITTGSTNVIVAVVDTGIRYTHQDLAANMWRNPGESGDGKETNGVDDDGDGYVDNVYGINAVTGSGDPTDDSVFPDGSPLGHGTHVAGTIGAAANDGNPHVGAAWNVRLMACKVFDASGSAYPGVFVTDEVESLQFALTHGARIINASYGGPFFSQAEFEAIKNLRDHGALFVAAAGNDARDNDSSPSYPASYDLHNIIAVAAVDRSDTLASFSNFGRTSVHLGAPGVDIFSCYNASDTAYTNYPGTSMASPHVVGAAALLLSRYPTATLTELRRRILDGAVPIPSLTNMTVTGGRLNVHNSLLAIPEGSLRVEVSPRAGMPLAAGKSATLLALVTDLLPVTNATVTAHSIEFTDLALIDNGSPPDALPGDGVYTATFLVPTNLTTLEVTLTASAPGWPTVTSFISYPVALPPPNDDFATRTTIPQSDCDVILIGSNFNASRETGEPDHLGYPFGASSWWSWTAPFTGSVRISTAGSGFDTLLAVYTNQTLSTLGLVGENDDADYDYSSAVGLDAVAGVEYQIAVDGYAVRQGQVVLRISPLTSSIALADALDCPGLRLTSEGNQAWLGQRCVTHDGTDAVQSGPIAGYGQSWMETRIVGPGVLTFWWTVSSQENGDWLQFQVNGMERSHISGELNWLQERCWLGSGTNTLRWTYNKNKYGTVAQDAGWVDEVCFAQAQSALPFHLGDVDRDSQPTVLDLTLLVGYLGDANSLLPQVAVFADVDTNGIINSNDVAALADAILGRQALQPALDTDGDGIPDVLEPLLGLDPALTNSPGDTLPDAERDFDMDGLSNARELQLGTDPLQADTDGDGWSDEAELTAMSSPLDATSRPYIMVVSTPQVALVLPAVVPEAASNAIVMAQPPISLVLPASMPEVVTNSTFVALPPVSLVLPALAPEAATNATVVASPPVALVLPADQGTAGLTHNTVIAMPPLRIELHSP